MILEEKQQMIGTFKEFCLTSDVEPTADNLNRMYRQLVKQGMTDGSVPEASWWATAYFPIKAQLDLKSAPPANAPSNPRQDSSRHYGNVHSQPLTGEDSKSATQKLLEDFRARVEHVGKVARGEITAPEAPKIDVDAIPVGYEGSLAGFNSVQLKSFLRRTQQAEQEAIQARYRDQVDRGNR